MRPRASGGGAWLGASRHLLILVPVQVLAESTWEATRLGLTEKSLAEGRLIRHLH